MVNEHIWERNLPLVRNWEAQKREEAVERV